MDAKKSHEGGEGQGGSFLVSPSHLSEALPTMAMLAVSLVLSAMLAGLLAATLVGP